MWQKVIFKIKTMRYEMTNTVGKLKIKLDELFLDGVISDSFVVEGSLNIILKQWEKEGAWLNFY